MGSRDHSITCETCGAQRGGLNDYKCLCAETPRARRYAKKRELIRAVQWLGGEKTPELFELLGQRGHYDAENERLELGGGWYARASDWICSASGEDLFVISDKVFRRIYEEVDETGASREAAGVEIAAVVEDRCSGELAAKLHAQCSKIPLADLRTAIDVHRANCRQPMICPVLIVMEAHEAVRRWDERTLRRARAIDGGPAARSGKSMNLPTKKEEKP